jgi:opacity protein-like surface antigen
MNISRVKTCGLASILALSAAPALSQESGWTFSVSTYLWINDTTITADTPRGQVTSTLDFSDAIDQLDFAYMGTIEARNGPWGVIGDLLYFKLSADGPTPNGLLFSGVEAESETTILNTYLTYRVHEDANVSVDLGAGVRALWLESDTTLIGSGIPTEQFTESKDLFDPVVAARVRFTPSEKWFGQLTLDAGGTNDSKTWQALATVGYKLNERWILQAGYRYLEAEWDTNLGETSLEFFGPIIGATYRF